MRQEIIWSAKDRVVSREGQNGGENAWKCDGKLSIPFPLPLTIDFHNACVESCGC